MGILNEKDIVSVTKIISLIITSIAVTIVHLYEDTNLAFQVCP